MLIEIVLLVLFLIGVFHYVTRYGRIGKLVEDIPGIPAWPIVGNLPHLMGLSSEEAWNVFRKLNNDYYPIFKFWTTHEVVINIRHPDDVEVLLTSIDNIDKSTAYHLLQPWLKTGLLTSTGKKWQERRKILTPAFHFNVLKKLMEIITENCEKTIKSLKLNNRDESVDDLLQFTANHTLNIICETAMGVSLDQKKDFQKKYRDSVHEMGEIMLYRIARPWFRNERIFSFTEKGKDLARHLNVLHNFSKKIIKERKEYHTKTNDCYLCELELKDSTTEMDVNMFGFQKKRMAMLDLLISCSKTGSHIDDQGIQEEVDTFIFEGHDTVAMGLSFSLLLLAENKSAQTRARNEINDLFKKNDGKIGFSDMQQLHYLEMCIKESLRLYPSAPFISRRITKDLKLKNHIIPKGAITHVHIYDLHRDKNFWSEPEKFDPERFLPENARGRHPFSYVPFSAGPRNCIGN
ncbi:cytochrome P450 4C1-like isoform X2 [Copidosoma floridanum]|uniref:cytochrome P450 4C1-like isoform X2 n=1 Tax=Copidosoma floridanum TaxID=29053 RepID=UPI0006C95E5E|nr:cytochrome P450 4C1-like isoform X2 [Copidosoma floridanum]